MKRLIILAILAGTFALPSCTNNAPSGSGARPEEISPGTEAERNMNATPNAPAPTGDSAGQIITQDTMNRGQ